MKELGKLPAPSGMGKVIIEFLEYVLMFTVIIECNSLFHYSENYCRTTLEAVVTVLAVVVAAILAWYFGLRRRGWLRAELSSAKILWAALFTGIFLFLALNVLRIGAESALRKYTLSFVLFLPLALCLFRAYGSVGRRSRLFFKYSDLVCVIAISNLAIFAAVTARPEIVQALLMKTRWSGFRYLRSLYNYLNFCCVSSSVTRTLFGFTIYRNSAFFPEPLMYCIPLITALFTEMFLRIKEERRVWRWALLIAAVLTSQSTLGMLLAAGALGIKLIEWVKLKRKWIMVFPTLIFIALAVVILLRQKASLGGESSAAHIWHYVAAWKAFLEHPLIGCGFLREDEILRHLTTEQLQRTVGLSNSVAVVLAEGGMLLGCLCMAPFFIGLAQIFSKDGKRIALWTLGPLGLYCVTVFHFHLLLLLFMAFGYSLAVPAVVQERGEEASVLCGRSSGLERAVRIAAILLGCCSAASLFLSERAWLAVSRWLKVRQLYLGQSAWKVYFFSLFLILAALVIRYAVREAERKTGKRWIEETVWFLLFSMLFAAIYPTAYSVAATILARPTFFGDLFESAALALVYFGGVAIGWLLIALQGRRSRLFAPLLTCSVLLLVSAAAGSYLYASQPEGKAGATAEAVKEIAAASGGGIFANEKPAALKSALPELRFSPARNGAFAALEDASVIAGHSQNLFDLLDAGFEVTELSSEYILYTNDASVIAALQSKGFVFARYYPFPIPAGEESAAILRRGSYTLTAELRKEPEQAAGHKPVCTVRITAYYGTQPVAERTVYADEFDAEGRCTVSLPFTSGEWEGIEYTVVSENEAEVCAESLMLLETPVFLTERSYDGRYQVIREAYYEPSGEPHYLSQGYAALAREYDRAGRIIRQTYLNDQGSPVMTKEGCAGFSRSFNRKGMLEREAYFDAEGMPCLRKERYAAVVYGYDGRGNLTSLRYLDEKGDPIITAWGYAEVRRSFDGNRRLQCEAYYGVSGEPAARADGVASVYCDYDANGREIGKRCYDLDGQEIPGS